MATDLKQKVKCVCSHYISLKNMESHLKTKTHLDRLISKKRTEIPQEKLAQYDDHKDEYNCCSQCYRIKIPDIYFNNNTNSCLACEEISLNQDKLCKYCNTIKNITLFERPYLTKCKACAAKRAKTKITCTVCGKICDYGTFSKHKKIHTL